MKELRYMLSEEEKKAIEQLKKVRWNSLAIVVKNEDGKMDISYFTEKHKKTIINLIENQQKELDNNTERINELINEVTLKDSEIEKKEQEIKELKKQLIALTYKSSVKGVRR